MTAAAYTRAYINREAAAAGQPGDPIEFVAATEGIKGDGIDLRMSGARLGRYLANPVVGYNHSYWGRDGLPIGRGEGTRIDGDKLRISVVFDQEDEFATKVERKYRAGFLNAVSIGFDVQHWEDGKGNYWLGGVAEQWELTELSCVPIPMDPEAVAQGGRSAMARLRSLAALLDAPPDDHLANVEVPVEIEAALPEQYLTVRVTSELARTADPLRLALAIAHGLQRAAFHTTPDPVDDDPGDQVAPVDDTNPPAPAAEEIDQDAARTLLAALTTGGTAHE